MQNCIYICSRSLNKDYYWKSAYDQTHEAINFSWCESSFQLIYDAEFSLVLRRNSERLLLLIAGLKTNRKDGKTGAYIRNAIAWIAPYTEEAKIRKIAAIALGLEDQSVKNFRFQNGLHAEDNIIESIVDKAVYSLEVIDDKEDNLEDGFGIKLEELEVLNQLEEAACNEDDQSERKEIPSREKLAEDLNQYCLPSSKDFAGDLLVLVTEVKTGKLGDAWRSFPPPPSIQSSPKGGLLEGILNCARNNKIFVVASLIIISLLFSYFELIDRSPQPLFSIVVPEKVLLGDTNFIRGSYDSSIIEELKLTICGPRQTCNSVQVNSSRGEWQANQKLTLAGRRTVKIEGIGLDGNIVFTSEVPIWVREKP